MTGRSAQIRPLLERPGARYACFGDGLCCTDIHGLGPLTRRELVQLRRIDPGGAAHDELFEAPMLQTDETGACHFLLEDGRCGVHARHGPRAKPSGCRRFPLGLVATPSGGRVTTDHRCPCRTLGDRPEITPKSAIPSLVDDAGRLVADRRVERISLDRRRHVTFARWEKNEAGLLRRLARGQPPARVLDAPAYPRLAGVAWDELADEVEADADDGSRFGAMLGWAIDAIRARCRGYRAPSRERPWAPPFDRAERRAGEATRPAREVLADWIADEIWSLAWTDRGSFHRARHDLATRLHVAEHVTRRLQRAGARADRAAAEGVMIAETIGCAEHWGEIVAAMRIDSSKGGEAATTPGA